MFAKLNNAHPQHAGLAVRFSSPVCSALPATVVGRPTTVPRSLRSCSHLFSEITNHGLSRFSVPTRACARCSFFLVAWLYSQLVEIEPEAVPLLRRNSVENRHPSAALLTASGLILEPRTGLLECLESPQPLGPVTGNVVNLTAIA